MQSLYCPTKVYIRLTFTLMMAVRQTPLSRFVTQYFCECGTIICCSVAVIPLSALYSCIFASFSLDTVGQRL